MSDHDSHIQTLLGSPGEEDVEVGSARHNQHGHAFVSLAEDADHSYTTAYTLQTDPNIEPSFFEDRQHTASSAKRSLDHDDGSQDISTMPKKQRHNSDSPLSHSPELSCQVVTGNEDELKIDHNHHKPMFKESKPRAQKACDACRRSKSRCATIEETDPPVCLRCQNRGTQCTWVRARALLKPRT